jgi:hypothetical protein
MCTRLTTMVGVSAAKEMTRNEVRYTAHATLERVERLERIVAPRMARQADEVEFLFEDLRKAMLRIIGTYSTDQSLAQAEAEADD